MCTHNKNWWEITHVINQEWAFLYQLENPSNLIHDPEKVLEHMESWRIHDVIYIVTVQTSHFYFFQTVKSNIVNYRTPRSKKRINDNHHRKNFSWEARGDDREASGRRPTVHSCISDSASFNICHCLLTSGAVVHHHIEWAVASLKSFNHAL